MFSYKSDQSESVKWCDVLLEKAIYWSQNLKPVDEAISNCFIPNLFGCEISEKEKSILSLPIKEGGLGLC